MAASIPNVRSYLILHASVSSQAVTVSGARVGRWDVDSL